MHTDTLVRVHMFTCFLNQFPFLLLAAAGLQSAAPPRGRCWQCDLCEKAIERNVMRCKACNRGFHLECMAADWSMQVGVQSSWKAEQSMLVGVRSSWKAEQSMQVGVQSLFREAEQSR